MQAVEELKKGYFNARKLGVVKKLHLTLDFYLQLKADRDIETVASLLPVLAGEKDVPLILGFDPVIHDASGEFWFDVDEWNIVQSF